MKRIHLKSRTGGRHCEPLKKAWQSHYVLMPYNISIMESIILEKLILSALEEDKGLSGDITSNSLIDKEHKSKFQLVVNQGAVLAGFNIFKKTFNLVDKNVLIETNFKDGDCIEKGDIVCNISGNTLTVLFAERTSLNYLSHLSGIATVTHELVELIKHTNAILLDTRKTTPNLRLFEKAAVIAGGAKNHRFNLSEMILIKDNHIVVAGGVKNAILSERKSYKDKYKIEVEVNTFDELKEAVLCKPDIIMFDNWNIKDLKVGLKLIPEGILTEVSGQISKENIKDYAECGVNYISTSYMIKNSKWVDFSLDAIC